MKLFWTLPLGVCSLLVADIVSAAQAKPIRKLSYDENAPAVNLLGENAKGKLSVRAIPQDEFRSRILLENQTDRPLTVRLPKAIAAVHVIPPEDAEPPSRVRAAAEDLEEPEEATAGTGQAVVGTFGPMNAKADGFPHESAEGSAFTIPAGRSVQILLHSACAEHGKRPPISRMTYELKPLAEQSANEELEKIVASYDPKSTDALAFQAAVWHLANGLSWQVLAQKTVKKGGQSVPYFTRPQLIAAQKLIADAEE